MDLTLKLKPYSEHGYDSLEANNDYICTLENVKVDALSQTIEKLKEVTRNHSLLINFDKIISKTM